MKKFVLTRDVTTKECHWLDNDLKKGDMVYEYTNYTYGCISPNGKAFCDETGSPFFELPLNSVDLV